jgi:hypothetical protein
MSRDRGRRGGRAGALDGARVEGGPNRNMHLKMIFLKSYVI